MSFFSLKDSFVKLLDGYYSAIVVMWAQMLFASILYAPLVSIKYGFQSLWPTNPFLQILRASSVVTGIGMFYWSITIVPLAEATAITFVAPLVTTAISPILLREKVGIRRWVSVFIGFIGIMIVLRPEFSGDRIGYVIAFAAGVSIGFFYAFNRLLASSAPPIVNLTYSSVIGAILLTPLIFSVWINPRVEDWGIIIGFCSIAAMGQTCLFNAFLYGEASLLAPFTLSQIVFATIFGYMFFNDFPDSISILGIVIIVVSAAYIAIRETQSHS